MHSHMNLGEFATNKVKEDIQSLMLNWNSTSLIGIKYLNFCNLEQEGHPKNIRDHWGQLAERSGCVSEVGNTCVFPV